MAKKFNFRICTVAAIIIISPLTSFSRNSKWLDERAKDNMSMMEYAQENHRRLSKQAKSTSIDPDFSSWQSLWTYRMPDGKVIRCTRGILNDIFMYECKEK